MQPPRTRCICTLPSASPHSACVTISISSVEGYLLRWACDGLMMSPRMLDRWRAVIGWNSIRWGHDRYGAGALATTSFKVVESS